jgi:hypothetical protein
VQLTATQRGWAHPFEGDRTLVLRGLPEGARVTAARVTVSPDSADPLERIEFADTRGDWGATQSSGGGQALVEFHARRRLVSVEGTGGATALKHVELGGALVPVAADGTLGGPGTGFPVTLGSSAVPLPSLEVTGFRLSATPPAQPVVNAVTIRSFPLNVTVALGRLGPFLIRLGELGSPVTSDDFAPILQGFLESAEVVGGVHVLPFVVHSDAIARLDLTIEIEFLRTASLLPDGLSETRLAFDHGSVAEEGGDVVGVTLPPGAAVVPKHTAASVNGAFEPTRVVVGELGRVDAPARAPVSASRSQAQPIAFAKQTVDGIDVLLAAGPGGGSVSATLFGDADGKPFGDPLAAPVTFALVDAAPAPVWLSAALSAEFQFRAGVHYWLVLRPLQGAVEWAAKAAPAGAVGLQVSADGGLSWRETGEPARPGPWQALLRLRATPAGFRMPIELRAGDRRLGLERFEPLGRVDFAIDPEDLSALVNGALADAPGQRCPTVEHLANGDFARWQLVGEYEEVPEEWEVTAGVVLRVGNDERTAQLGGALVDEITGLSQVVPVTAGCPYELAFAGWSSGEDAVAEIIWLGGDCLDVRTDRVPIQMAERGHGFARLPLIRHRLRVRAPAGATQAEVRFLVPSGMRAHVTGVSLRATDEALSNPDLAEQGPAPETVPGWAAELDRPLRSGEEITVEPTRFYGLVRNASDTTLRLVQRVPVTAGRPYAVDAHAVVLEPPTAGETAVALAWAPALTPAEDLLLPLSAPGFDRVRAEGVVPDGVAEADVRIVVPPRAYVVVLGVSVRIEQPVDLALDVVAQAPGDLRLRDARVAYDLTPPDPPPVPARGLCTPTAPTDKPGRPEHCTYCPCCGTEQSLTGVEAARTLAGRPAVTGRCAGCGTEVSHLGGPLMHGARVIGHPAVVEAALTIVQPVPDPEARPRSLEEVDGIGKARASRLEAGGIRSLGDLAAAEPDMIARVLRPLSADVAVGLMIDARRLLASDPEPDPSAVRR